jgi:hypothetical protein
MCCHVRPVSKVSFLVFEPSLFPKRVLIVKFGASFDVTNIVDQHVPVDRANASADSSTTNTTKGDNTGSGREKSSATLDSEVSIAKPWTSKVSTFLRAAIRDPWSLCFTASLLPALQRARYLIQALERS